jgi:hypothetical protein
MPKEEQRTPSVNNILTHIDEKIEEYRDLYNQDLKSDVGNELSNEIFMGRIQSLVEVRTWIKDNYIEAK